jgi:hypothetical protein
MLPLCVDCACGVTQAADLDKSGMVNKEELAVVIKEQLHIQLQDPVNDLDIIFGTSFGLGMGARMVSFAFHTRRAFITRQPGSCIHKLRLVLFLFFCVFVCVCACVLRWYADSLDEDKSGLVSMEEFCKLFEPTIVRRASSSGACTHACWRARAVAAICGAGSMGCCR